MAAPASTGAWARLRNLAATALAALDPQRRTAPQPPLAGWEWGLLALLLLAGLVLRVGLAVAFPSLYHPDEQFQYWEQGYRLAHGFGIVPWEYRAGIRSPLVPGLLAGLYRLAAALGGGPDLARLLGQALLSACSLAPIATAYFWARRAAGVTGAVIAGFVACTWYEFVYFGPKPLTEVIAAAALFPAAYLLCALPHPARRHLVAGGLLLGLAFVLRFQLAPAIAVIGIAALLQTGWRRLLWALLPALAVISAGGILDWLVLGQPFQSIWLNFHINAIEDRSSLYGRKPVFWYLLFFANAWPGIVAVLLLLFALGCRRAPLLFALPLVIVLAHSLIGHKEYRFVYPALPFLMTLAGIGAALAVERLAPSRRRLGLGLMLFGWLLTSASLIGSDSGREWLLERQADTIAAYREAGSIEDICGVALGGKHWAMAGGNALLGRDVPMYLAGSREAAEALAPAYDVLIYGRDRPDMVAPGYAPLACHGDLCVAHRAGACTPQPDATINAELVRIGE